MSEKTSIDIAQEKLIQDLLYCAFVVAQYEMYDEITFDDFVILVGKAMKLRTA